MALLAASWIPVWVLDSWLLAPGGGGWISLDFRGLLIFPYVGATVIFAAVTTPVILIRQPDRGTANRIYGATGLGIVLLSALSFVLWHRADQREQEARLSGQTAMAVKLADAVSLRSWQPTTDQVNLVVDFNTPFSRVEFHVKASDRTGAVVAEGDGVSPDVPAGPLRISLPINRYGDTTPISWIIRLGLETRESTIQLEYVEDPYPGEGALVVRPLP